MAINPFKKLSLFVFIFFLAENISAQIYVNLAATGANNGSSWTDAYLDLQDALANTTSGEIWVAKGTYYPTSSTDRNVSFVLNQNVDLYGGFAGNETSISQRNISVNKTELSGNIGSLILAFDNSYIIIRRSAGLAANLTIDGFTIADAYNSDVGLNRGGGIFIDGPNSGPLNISNCTFDDNFSLETGGALYSNNSIVDISNCSFNNNDAVDMGGAIYIFLGEMSISNSTMFNNTSSQKGGAVYLLAGELTISNSDISINHSDEGGAIFNTGGELTLINSNLATNSATRGGSLFLNTGELIDIELENCTLRNNTSTSFGGAIYSDAGSLKVIKSLFQNNSGTNGGALYVTGDPLGYNPNSAELNNCVLINNQASVEGGAIYINQEGELKLRNSTLFNNPSASNAAVYSQGSPSSMINSIIWANSISVKLSFSSILTASNCILENGYTSCTNCPNGNGDIDPMFIDSGQPLGPDNELSFDDGLRLSSSSPAVNAGAASITTPVTDILDNPRIGLFDLGAYERCFGDSILFVNQVATGNEDGSSWADAKTSLADALLLANTCEDVKEIWVAAGTYLPAYDNSGMPSTGKQTTFRLSSNLSLLGGFDGTETDKSQRDHKENLCVLSGDLLQNDNGFSGNGENSWTLVRGNGISDFLLDGFTIRGCQSVGESALAFNYGSGIIRNVILKENVGQHVVQDFPQPGIEMDQCVIINNVCSWYVLDGVNSISNSFIHDNQSDASNGAAVRAGSITNSVVSNTKRGIAGLRANGIEGGIVTNCTVVLNEVGVRNATIKNSILWDNNLEFTNSTVSYSNVEGLGGGTGNINLDPQFVNLSDPDGVDDEGGTLDDGVAILAGSPAKDASDPSTTDPSHDLTGDARLGVFDMGAYEVKCNNGFVYFVNKQASGNYNGTTWANADTSLAKAIYLARNCYIVEEIWVAEGTYYPEGAGQFPDPDQRNHTFELGDSISIYGGFDGTESQLSERDYVNHPAILSGDFNDDDVINGSGASLSISNNSENAYSVISVFNKQNIVLDGITVKGGNSPFAAGGIFTEDSNMEIRNSIFEEHYSDFTGAALYADSMASIRLVNCIFRMNKSLYQETDIYMGYGSNLLVKDCWLYR